MRNVVASAAMFTALLLTGQPYADVVLAVQLAEVPEAKRPQIQLAEVPEAKRPQIQLAEVPEVKRPQ
ncbi:MAG: hypothetical protein ACREV5_01555, partial [Steroidobacter sp.]